MIEVRSISKFYGNKRAVEDLSFTIKDGEIVGLLGLNGAGKSTILKVLGCFLVPSHGDARIGGHSVLETPDDVRRMIGYLPDTPPLYNEMPTRDYLRFVAKLKNVSSEQVPSFVDDAMNKTNLHEVSDVRLGELSHGFRQRVGIAQALVHKPRVLILDEPINGLDPIQIVEMRDMILSLKGQHTVILSSHILSEITKTCDRILVLDRGRLVAEGTEAQLRGQVKQGLDVRVEVESFDASVRDALRALPGVIDVKEARISGFFLDIQCSSDIRGDIARTIVQSGGRLLGLGKKEAELETLFLKLIKTDGAN
ncbi:MAG TPA: ABC transporter ATP-binding protein [Oligoflexus sp.]|uniref:ABC transporter ATP-binding protein n=1 Tax=Oligoflexus sp. TaxID=1971216 RepID=UPI002D747927|nr:ABC transporter ATP-binding protein [Oligoflexus sp.]HYX39882.1 ABC transporter ATP-binding protein [Oligoflexus sp.]